MELPRGLKKKKRLDLAPVPAAQYGPLGQTYKKLYKNVRRLGGTFFTHADVLD